MVLWLRSGLRRSDAGVLVLGGVVLIRWPRQNGVMPSPQLRLPCDLLASLKTYDRFIFTGHRLDAAIAVLAFAM
jgi:hypothetical protein